MPCLHDLVSLGRRTISWDVENRPVNITMGSVTTTFAYDGDGKRVKKAETNGSTVTTTVYIGDYLEKVFVNSTLTDTVKYYYAGGKRIAMRRAPTVESDTLYYMFADHLGGTSVVLNASSGVSSTVNYYPYGARRSSTGNPQTDRLFAGYRWEDSSGLYQVGSRWYDAGIGRFVQPDGTGQAELNDSAAFMPLTVSFSEPPILRQLNDSNRRRVSNDLFSVQELDPQLLNRYAYSRDNPLVYHDTSGHFVIAVPVAAYYATAVVFAGFQWWWSQPDNPYRNGLANAAAQAANDIRRDAGALLDNALNRGHGEQSAPSGSTVLGSSDFPKNPDDWVPPPGVWEEPKAREGSGGKIRHWYDQDGRRVTEWHEGEPEAPGWRGKNHWHDRTGDNPDERILPDDEDVIPDEGPVDPSD